MVETRRTRSANNSIASSVNDDEIGSVISARGLRIPRARAPPPPPPLPPPPPPPQQLGAPEENVPSAADQDQQQEAAAGMGVVGAGEMAAIPEEVEVNNDTANGAEEENIMNEGNNDVVAAPNNNNVATIAVPPPAIQQRPIQYLQVRVPPPSQYLFRPSRIHRRHHRRPPPPNNTPHNTHNQSRLRRKGKGSSPPPSHPNEGEIVRILIPRNGFASEQQLAECLSQAGAADVPVQDDYQNRWNDDFGDDYSMDEYFDDRMDSSHVAGMFRESDRVFVPLSIIYTEPHSFVGEVLCLKHPPPPPRRPQFRPTPKPSRSIFITFLEIMGIVVVAFASWFTYGAAQRIDWEYVLEEVEYYLGEFMFKLEQGFFALVNLPFWLFDTLIEFPLREIYRHGPSVIGWEGEPLPRICARITYHGDEAFWARNIDECEQIYYAKERAAMQVRKPIVVGLLILAAFFMIKSIVAARALRRRERIDPNMVETYRAIQMLTRQLRRAMNTR